MSVSSVCEFFLLVRGVRGRDVGASEEFIFLVADKSSEEFILGGQGF